MRKTLNRHCRFEALEDRRVLDAGLLAYDRYEIDQNSEQQMLDVLANDQLDANARIEWVGEPDSGGTARIGESGRDVVFQPNAHFTGRERFAYRVGDRIGVAIIDVVSELQNDEATVFRGAVEKPIFVLSNDALVEGHSGPGIITHVTAAREGASVRISEDGRLLLYQASDDAALGPDKIYYTVDGHFSAELKVQISKPQPRSPWPQWDLLIEGPFKGPRVLDVLANDGALESLQIDAVSESSLGAKIELGPDGRFLIYTPPTNELVEGHYLDEFTYQVLGQEVLVWVSAEIDEIRGSIDPCYPEHWGPLPGLMTADLWEWPAGFGFGSGTMVGWINGNLAWDEANGVPLVKPCGWPEADMNHDGYINSLDVFQAVEAFRQQNDLTSPGNDRGTVDTTATEKTISLRDIHFIAAGVRDRMLELQVHPRIGRPSAPAASDAVFAQPAEKDEWIPQISNAGLIDPTARIVAL